MTVCTPATQTAPAVESESLSVVASSAESPSRAGKKKDQKCGPRFIVRGRFRHRMCVLGKALLL